MENLNNWNEEINRDWTTGYSLIRDGELRVYNDNHELVLTVDEYNEIEVHSEDYEEFVDQVSYMITR